MPQWLIHEQIIREITVAALIERMRVRFILICFTRLASIDTLSQPYQHPFLGVHILSFPQGEPALLIGCHLFLSCVCVMIGCRVRTLLVNKPQQLALTRGCFTARRRFAERNIQQNRREVLREQPSVVAVPSDVYSFTLDRGNTQQSWRSACLLVIHKFSCSKKKRLRFNSSWLEWF